MQGPEALQHLLSIHFRAPGLARHVQDRPAMLYFTFGPDSVAVAVAHDIPGGEWVLQVLFCQVLRKTEVSACRTEKPSVTSLCPSQPLTTESLPACPAGAVLSSGAEGAGRHHGSGSGPRAQCSGACCRC